MCFKIIYGWWNFGIARPAEEFESGYSNTYKEALTTKLYVFGISAARFFNFSYKKYSINLTFRWFDGLMV